MKHCSHKKIKEENRHAKYGNRFDYKKQKNLRTCYKNMNSIRSNNSPKKNSKNNKKNPISNDRIKDSEIKIRVNKEQKKALQNKAKRSNMSLSKYLLTPHTQDANELLPLIPDAVDTWNMLNELFRTLESTPDTQIIQKINNILRMHLQKNNQHFKGDFYDERIN